VGGAEVVGGVLNEWAADFKIGKEKPPVGIYKHFLVGVRAGPQVVNRFAIGLAEN
jgi:hypothetical protein